MPVMMRRPSAKRGDIWDLDGDGFYEWSAVPKSVRSDRPTVETVLAGSSMFWREEVFAGLEQTGRVRVLPESMYRGGDFEDDTAPIDRVQFVAYEETDDDIGW